LDTFLLFFLSLCFEERLTLGITFTGGTFAKGLLLTSIIPT